MFSTSRKQDGVEKAVEALRLIRGVFQIVPLDELVIDRALAAPGRDFEDAIQAAAAIRIAADYLVTRNVADFQSGGVPTITAEELLAVLQP